MTKTYKIHVHGGKFELDADEIINDEDEDGPYNAFYRKGKLLAKIDDIFKIERVD